MHQPELLILDEPTSGLDPLVQQEFYGIIETCRERGVQPSSPHTTCPRWSGSATGRHHPGRPPGGRGRSGHHQAARLHHLEIHFASPPPPGAFDGVPGLRDIRSEDSVIHCTVQGSMDPLVKAIARFEVTNILSYETPLEDIFLTYYGEGENHAQ